jgi:SAM-dependent methyltransferase
MDSRTLEYYGVNAAEVFDKYDKAQRGISRYFQVSFPVGTRILDIGAGSGRDMRQLLEEGYDVYGVEPCDELRNITIAKYPELSQRLSSGYLPDIEMPSIDKFDGILCSAVLMHIPSERLFDAAFSIRRLLKNGGRLLISMPYSRDDIDNTNRDQQGRLFNKIPIEFLELLFERLGFRKIGRWINEDGLRRKNYSWVTLLFHLNESLGLRPIDQIEGVLNRDRKTATYKLALFRALSEIAVTNFHRAQWRADGTVGIPINDVVERWISYYWPIFESAKFIPQINGETSDYKIKIAFRPLMDELISHYKHSGRLTRFTLDYRNSEVNNDVKPLIYKLINTVRKTIVKGPIAFAGGSLESGTLFTYDSTNKVIVLGADIWKELSLMANWVLDALILRWAELTCQIAKNEVKASEIIDLLLTVPIPERDVESVRQIYRTLKDKECVWTGKALSNTFEVDHVLPFSLWRNNDLWNLLPIHSNINRSKSNKLPKNALLLQRKSCIIDYWKVIRTYLPNRFDFEATKIVGLDRFIESNWECKMFDALVEAVEVTALQRGCERWAP